MRPLILLSGGLGLLLLAWGSWIPAKAVVAQYLLKQAWQQAQHSGESVLPWPWADTWPVGRLRSERLNHEEIILAGQSGEALAFGPGHLPGSALPGKEGHCVLAGHRDTSFAFLRELQAGDILHLEGQGATARFQVEEIVVLPAETLHFNSQAGDRLTLVTCYAQSGEGARRQLRLVVAARRLPELG